MQLHEAGLRKSVCVIFTLLLLLQPSYAITANTIRGLYGVPLQQDITPLIKESREVSAAIRDASSRDLYNEVLAAYPIEELEAKQEAYAIELSSLASQIKCDVTLSLEELLALEQDYYSTREQADLLSQTLDTVRTLDTLTQTEDVEALRESFESLQKAIATAGYFDDIGRFGVWPAKNVRKQYNSGFGSRWDPITNDGYTYHSGVDIYAPMYTDVVAVFSGTVHSTGYSVSSGNYIYIDHGHGVRTFYCHLSQVNVAEGNNVTQGTTIALSGNTGTRTTGPHLHFGVMVDGGWVDPKVVLERG